MPDPSKLPLRISRKETAYQCPFMEITHQRAEFDGFTKNYYVVNFKRRSGVVALKEGEVLLVRQYRFLPNDTSWELPGGTIEDHEDLESGLVRECLEETGVRVSALRVLVEYYPGLDNVDNQTTVYLSEQTEAVAPFRGNPAEILEIAWIPLERCLRMVFDREILDAMTVAGLLACDHALRRRATAVQPDRT